MSNITVFQVIDWAAVLTAIGSFLGYMPMVAPLFPMAWFSYQIYDLYQQRKSRGKDK